MMKQQHISKKHLKNGRGWTDALIERFFPVPTKERINMHYKTGPKVKLYDVDRVCEIEATAAFQEMKKKAETRSASAKLSAERQAKKTITWAENLPHAQVPKYSTTRLMEVACKHYNALWADRDPEKRARSNDNEDFLCRIAVNFLRHELTPYENQLLAARGRIGADEARLIIRERALEAIADAYPELAPECYEQMRKASDAQSYKDCMRR